VSVTDAAQACDRRGDETHEGRRRQRNDEVGTRQAEGGPCQQRLKGPVVGKAREQARTAEAEGGDAMDEDAFTRFAGRIPGAASVGASRANDVHLVTIGDEPPGEVVEVLARGRDVGRVILIDEEEAHAQRIIPQRVARSSRRQLSSGPSLSIRHAMLCTPAGRTSADRSHSVEE